MNTIILCILWIVNHVFIKDLSLNKVYLNRLYMVNYFIIILTALNSKSGCNWLLAKEVGVWLHSPLFYTVKIE